MIRQALELRTKLLGGEHPDTLFSMNSLAGVLGSQGSYEEAEMMHQQALELAYCWNIATTAGSVNALLQLEDVPLDAGPGERVPSIHRCWSIRVHSL